MKNYILMLGIAAVALGSYCAYAGNSATMTVTATIAHDVSLTKTGDLDLGTITTNPAYDGDDTDWSYDYTGNIIYYTQGAIVSAQDTRVGMFTANIANPADCNGIDIPCGGLSVTGNIGYSSIYNLFGGNDNSNHCEFIIKASEPEYNFAVFPFSCSINDVSKVTTGEHSGTLTISYNPE